MSEPSKTGNQIKIGVIISYILLIVNTFYGMIITPFILSHVGEGDYGVYKSVASLSATLAVMDLGLGSTTTRYMARFHAKNENEQAGNFLSMMFVQFSVIAALISAVAIGIYFSVPYMYADSFTSAQIDLAKTLIIILVLNMILRLFENLLFGVASGYERFVVSNGAKLLSVILKFSLILLLLPLNSSVLVIVLLETFITVSVTIFFLLYVIFKIKVIPVLRKWDNVVFKESMGYTVLMFIQTITVQFNGNVDNVLIGAMIDPASVTFYSMALTIFSMYENLSGSVANIMLPNMTKRVIEGQSSEQIQKGVEKAGKFQFMLLAAALGGFIVLGKDFFNLWLGSGYENCYWITLILIIPVTFPMMQNVCLSVLRAQNKMVYRTVTLAISCVINVIVTIVGIHFLGYWGAAIGTACATVANLIFMNVYYSRKLHFKIGKMFFNIMAKVLPCALIPTLIIGVVHHFFNGTWLSFLINAVIFCAIYAALICIIGLNKQEREQVFGRFQRR